jgi:hypothetical protein
MQSPPSVNKFDYPLDWYVARGVVRLSSEATQQAKEFSKELSSYEDKSKWIVGFLWALDRSLRAKADGPTFDEGPGIDLAGFRDTEILTNTVENVAGVRIVFILPPEVVAAAKAKLIVPSVTNSGRASFLLT